MFKNNKEQVVTVNVDGGYKPNKFKLKKGVPATINFNRKDPSGCLSEVLIPDFDVKKKLPLNETISIDINPETAGEYEFTCGMQMFRGKIVVK